MAAGEACLERYYGKVTMDVEVNMVLGSASTCADRLVSILEKGFDTLIIRLIVPDIRQIDLLGERVAPVI